MTDTTLSLAAAEIQEAEKEIARLALDSAAEGFRHTDVLLTIASSLDEQRRALAHRDWQERKRPSKPEEDTMPSPVITGPGLARVQHWLDAGHGTSLVNAAEVIRSTEGRILELVRDSIADEVDHTDVLVAVALGLDQMRQVLSDDGSQTGNPTGEKMETNDTTGSGDTGD